MRLIFQIDKECLHINKKTGQPMGKGGKHLNKYKGRLERAVCLYRGTKSIETFNRDIIIKIQMG